MNIQLPERFCGEVYKKGNSIYICTSDKGHSGHHSARGMDFGTKDFQEGYEIIKRTLDQLQKDDIIDVTQYRGNAFELLAQKVLKSSCKAGRLSCFIDGDSLCVTKDKFENLQEDDAVFIELTAEQRQEIRKLEEM